ncbi:hypothetical protein M569_11287, partial [Genlisea aurea]
GGVGNPPPPPPPPAAAAVAVPRGSSSSNHPNAAAGSPVARYRECLKNHAASMGAHVVDGCCEFMPSGGEGTAGELKCAACDCHRNFHRKEVEGENPRPSASYRPPFLGHHHHHQRHQHRPARPHNSGAAESSSEDLHMFESGHADNPSSKKRFRTKFSQEQKDQMQEFAEKLGWRMQKQDEHQVQQFCERSGVKKQVFKVWMHNNKRLKK